ncbi:MAG TPA: hypothetical protein VGM82_10140 [Gemmatimonadaceae bacterium]|jgi:hypothetical protein
MTIFRRRKQSWQDVDASLATKLTDARLQLHHAAQLVAAMGISYLPHADDDSHTNMEWLAGALASNVVGERPFRISVRPHPFELAVIGGDAELASYELNGRTINEAADWARGQSAKFGLDAARYTLAKHYVIPTHAVERGVPFDTSDAISFEQLQRWYDNADALLRDVASARDGSSVRCWPHHFDIATLLTLSAEKTIGIGLSPGDVYYDEPYWYVNRSPSPSTPPGNQLGGNGSWHSHEWIGAVLPGSRMADDQQRQVTAFIDSAVQSLSS